MSSKLNGKKKQGSGPEYTWERITVYLYGVLILGIFPLFYRNNYINIMESKFLFFAWTTFGALFFCSMFYAVSLAVKGKAILADFRRTGWRAHISRTDLFVLILSAAVLISWAGCGKYKAQAFDGSKGKMAGVYLYLVLVICYFLVSRWLKFDRRLFCIYMAVNFLVFGLAVLNHFMIDPLGMYKNLAESNYWMFITTMGNINVLAGYFCIFIPVAMSAFCFGTMGREAGQVSPLVTVLRGIVMTVAFMGIIAANGDAGILGLGCVFLFLLWFCFEDVTRLRCYFLMGTLFFAGAGVVGILDGLHGDTVKEPLATLPGFVAASAFNRIGLMLCILLTAVCWYFEKKQVSGSVLRLIRNSLYMALLCIFLLGMGTFLYLSTLGKDVALGAWENYLRFSDLWGSSRGFTWRRVLIIYFEKYTLFQKLFGCGPDLMGIQLHHYFNDEIMERMGAYLVDAHNELLQTLGTLGLAGAIGYMGMQFSGLWDCLKNWRRDPYLLALAAGMVGFLVQGMLGSPQTFSTPMLFMAIGIAEERLRTLRLADSSDGKDFVERPEDGIF